jgi:hypothetical protein
MYQFYYSLFIEAQHVSGETCWTWYKYGIIKFWYIVTPCWIFLYELNSDACWSVITYDASLKLISDNALQIPEKRSSYSGISTNVNNVATVRTIDGWVNNFIEPGPKLLMLDGGAWFFFVEYIIGSLFTSCDSLFSWNVT